MNKRDEPPLLRVKNVVDYLYFWLGACKRAYRYQLLQGGLPPLGFYGIHSFFGYRGNGYLYNSEDCY